MTNSAATIELIGPGGAGKSTVGALLAQRLAVSFVDLDRRFTDCFGDISTFIRQHDYQVYARSNVELYASLGDETPRPGVIALSSGFMTYADDVHLDYSRIRRVVAGGPLTFVLLPSLDRDRCVVETVRRQIGRPFGRSPEREEAVIRARFDVHMALPARKVETMRPMESIVQQILQTVPRVAGENPYALI